MPGHSIGQIQLEVLPTSIVGQYNGYDIQRMFGKQEFENSKTYLSHCHYSELHCSDALSKRLR